MIQIRGIVKAAQEAQSSLNHGIEPKSVLAFKAFVTNCVETIERLCVQESMVPEQLLLWSHSAYCFLKSIDLDNLPMIKSHTASQQQPRLCLKNIKRQQKTILEQISNLASSPTPDAGMLQTLSNTLAQTVALIETACYQKQLTPANLTNSARSLYAWMKFLADETHLRLHVKTTHQLQQIAQSIKKAHCLELTAVVEIAYLTGLYKSKRHGKTATIVINQGFMVASPQVLTALVQATLVGKSPEPTKVIRDFASSSEYSRVLLELELHAAAQAEQSKGKYYDLEQLFEQVNRQYFASSLSKPRLSWSQSNTYRKFGHYQPATDRVVLSSTLDDATVPAFVVEFVLYHELLHKYHKAKWSGNRRMVHTSEFKRDEQQFKFYKQAYQWLSKLASQHR